MEDVLALIFLSVTNSFNLPSGLLSSVCWVETHHVVTAINHSDHGSPSIGLCQVKLQTARYMGFKGTQEQLQIDPYINALIAGAYLRTQLNRYHGNIPMAIGAYNAGHFQLGRNNTYIKKVYKAWHFQK